MKAFIYFLYILLAGWTLPRKGAASKVVTRKIWEKSGCRACVCLLFQEEPEPFSED